MNKRTLILFTGVILPLVLVAAATGVFYQSAGAHINFITVRGEHATYHGSGLYYYDPASVALEGVVWDVVNLCLALPLFVLAIVLTWRGSLRGRLLLGGMLFYFFYQYMHYAVMLAFNPLFLVYVAIFGLSAVTFFLNLGNIKVSSLPAHISAHFPRWLFIVFTLIMSATLIVLWLGRVIPYTLAGHAGIRFRFGSSPAAIDSGSVVAAISMGILPGRHKPHIWVRDVYNPSRMDCCPVDTSGADEPRRSCSISALMPNRVVCGRAVLLECAGEGNSAFKR